MDGGRPSHSSKARLLTRLSRIQDQHFLAATGHADLDVLAAHRERIVDASVTGSAA